MNQLQAFHSFWTKPNSIRNQNAVSMADHELLTAMLSALKWRENYGPIKMLTDSAGAAYFRELGIDCVWNEVEIVLDDIEGEIDPFLFWAAGKLYALKRMQLPCVMLDTDLIIWKYLPWIERFDIVTAHPEDLNPYVYPDPQGFHLKEGYQYPEEWDFTVPAANTAFLYLRDPEFRDHYTDMAISFFQNVEVEGLNHINAMCFAEQRVIAMEASAAKKQMGYLLNLRNPETQDYVTHTWGFKHVLHNNPQAREEFCMRCLVRLLKDYPDMEDVVKNCSPLEKYYRLYKE